MFGEWTGSASELLARLELDNPMTLKQRRDWPKDATRLSGRLRRVVQSLREIGIAVETGTTGGAGGTREIKISLVQPK